MLYKVRKPKFINACSVNSKEASDLGVADIADNDNYVTGYCSACNKSILEHKILNGQFICPDSYIIYENNIVTGVMSKENFEELYTPLYEEEN